MNCMVCGGSSGALYRLPADNGGAEVRCLRHAVLARPVRRRALQLSGIVGTTLFVINQADVVLRGHLSFVLLFKVVLTYVVPYLVSTYSALGVSRIATVRADDGVGATPGS